MTTYRGDQAGTRHTRVSPVTWMWARLLGGAAVLAVLVWRLGTGPFLDAFHLIDGWSLAAAACIGALATVCCAWRWSVVARGLGVGVPLPAAVAAYYRSQFLNTTLPGGVLGDVHRAVRHGHDVGDPGLGLRAMGIPANIAGWGPREGVAAWVFSLVGMSAAQGVTTAVAYGAAGG